MTSPGLVQLEPFDATYKLGQATPFDRWFPLAESFSRPFVTKLLRGYMPEAKSLLDPFGGLGTTPLTAAALGVKPFYCEVNPVFQFVLKAKISVLAATAKRRAALARDLSCLAANVPERLTRAEPARDIKSSMQPALGSRGFFSPAQFRRVLQARTVQDRLTYEDPLLGALWGVAVLAALVPASETKRAGDLRYRRPEETHQRVALQSGIEKSLCAMAEDIADVTERIVSPTLLTADARDLDKLPPIGIDGVITSPPYLNGTNYCRNTKIEAWYLRAIKEPEDLRRLRSSAVVAGINGVLAKSSGAPLPEVAAIVSALEADIYDNRIPKMVAKYFADMAQVFDGVARHLSENAIVAVDIGDSVYGGHHIRTDHILSNVLASKGYSLIEKMPLRSRISRSGKLLSQSLMLFRVMRRGGAPRTVTKFFWEKGWKDFVEAPPHKRTPFSKRNWGHSAHSLCSYMGKLKPAIAHHLVRTFVPQGGSMLDPFAGVGTIPFEAGAYGCRSWTFEISPAALAIATGKCGDYSPAEVERCLDDVRDFVSCGVVAPSEMEQASAISFNGPLPDYFHHDTFKEIVLARRFFGERDLTDPNVAFVLACALHVLHGNRPYAASRTSHPLTPFAPSGPREYRNLMSRIVAKARRVLATDRPEGFVPGSVLEQDATETWPSQIHGLDAIVTSPPFFDSTRFYLSNWMRLWFSGWELEDFESMPRRFVEERQKQSFEVYRSVFRQARERLKPGGVLVMHLGKSHKCDMGTALSDMARPWFKAVDLYDEDVSRVDKHGVTDKGTVTTHQYLILV